MRNNVVLDWISPEDILADMDAVIFGSSKRFVLKPATFIGDIRRIL
jgi:hypothetical protein